MNMFAKFLGNCFALSEMFFMFFDVINFKQTIKAVSDYFYYNVALTYYSADSAI